MRRKEVDEKEESEERKRCVKQNNPAEEVKERKQ